MSGYAFVMGECIRCGRVFTFHPHHVPSTSVITGKREPVCRRCMESLNSIRRELGLEPFPILPDAYEACPEEEL
jgi:hypothetical protein